VRGSQCSQKEKGKGNKGGWGLTRAGFQGGTGRSKKKYQNLNDQVRVRRGNSPQSFKRERANDSKRGRFINNFHESNQGKYKFPKRKDFLKSAYSNQWGMSGGKERMVTKIGGAEGG